MKLEDIVPPILFIAVLSAAILGIRSCCKSLNTSIEEERVERQVLAEKQPMHILIDGVQYQNVVKSTTIVYNGFSYFKIEDK